jgi:hypothetical protein
MTTVSASSGCDRSSPTLYTGSSLKLIHQRRVCITTVAHDPKADAAAGGGGEKVVAALEKEGRKKRNAKKVGGIAWEEMNENSLYWSLILIINSGVLI